MITCYDLDLNSTYIEVDALGHNLTPFSSVKSYAIYVYKLLSYFVTFRSLFGQ